MYAVNAPHFSLPSTFLAQGAPLGAKRGNPQMGRWYIMGLARMAILFKPHFQFYLGNPHFAPLFYSFFRPTQFHLQLSSVVLVADGPVAGAQAAGSSLSSGGASSSSSTLEEISSYQPALQNSMHS
jgi:hypothetical protein